jgi:hypothetical protein
MAMDLSGFPYFEVEFTKEGEVFNPKQVDDLMAYLARGEATDLIVISHGWNNDMNDARATYRAFFESMRSVLDGEGLAGIKTRKLAVMAVLWPSKKFADKELIPSGAASAGSPVTNEVLITQLEGLKGVFSAPDADAKLDQAKALVPELENRRAAREEFANIMRSLAPTTAANNEDASDRVFRLDGEELMQRLSKPVLPASGPQGGSTGAATSLGGTQGGAAGFFPSFTGLKSAAFNLLNYLTYYQMKERAGTVGSRGVYTTLRRVQGQFPNLRVHLVGHSFGGRLVTAAAAGPDGQPPIKPQSLTLLQAAFSHYGFAQHFEGNEDGAFRRVLSNQLVGGPLVITHTQNDQAVGIAYPLASLIANQVASRFGDENDLYGGIGRNGAQKTPEAIKGELLATSGSYQFESGKAYNLKSDPFIKDHGDICGKEVMHAVLSAIAST